ncbi:hypothetical protein ACFQZT_33910 [Paenibacillus sp. GCM10027628]|uniref:hypothetical protein n=1 Tax=Paenibacillus sp. GCM10027628 TaxID=3273413 RepID=UPI003631CFC3
MDKNMLFYGDNLHVLRTYIKDDSVDLIYLDPPFNSNRNYNQIFSSGGKKSEARILAFEDTWYPLFSSWIWKAQEMHCSGEERKSKRPGRT